MNLMTFIKSQLGPRLGIFLGHILKKKQAYQLSDYFANRVAANTDSSVVQALRSNLAIVCRLHSSSLELDILVGKTLQNFARSIADWYLGMSLGKKFILSSCQIDEKIEQYVWQSIRKSQGVIIVSGHLSGFNMFLLALGVRKIPVQVLSYANPQGSYVIDNKIRRKFGINITPISKQSLKQAIRTLKEGGIVLTAVDRPDKKGEELLFFGQKALLPVGHIRLALRTNSNLVVGACQPIGNGVYHITGTPITRSKSVTNKQSEVVYFAQEIISLLEGYIRTRPEDWFMFYPVWDNDSLKL